MPARWVMRVVCAAAVSWSHPGLAEGESPDNGVDKPDREIVRLAIENDSLDRFGNHSDRFYTNGLRLDWERAGRNGDDAFLPGIDNADWCALLCGASGEEVRYTSGVSLGQNMYTPRVITEAANQPDDRPWAGVLYVARSATATSHEGGVERQDRVEVRLGIVGPAAHAAAAQKFVHRIFPSWPQPQGWRNQLRHEPALQLQYATARRFRVGRGDHMDITPRVRAHLGNLLVAVDAEATARIGWNLDGFGAPPPEFAPPPAARSTAPGAETMALAGRRPQPFVIGGNLFGRAGTRAVAHTVFLDGNTFARNDIRIARTPMVAELAAGFELRFRGPVTLTYQYIHRTSEFSSALGRAPGQNFGSVTLATAL